MTCVVIDPAEEAIQAIVMVAFVTDKDVIAKRQMRASLGSYSHLEIFSSLETM